MLRPIVGWFILLPFAAALIALAVSNRQAVTLYWNPLTAGSADGVTLPAFAWVFAIFALGVVAGGFAVWLAQGRFRRLARQRRRDLRAMGREVEALKAAAPPGSALPALAAPR